MLHLNLELDLTARQNAASSSLLELKQRAFAEESNVGLREKRENERGGQHLAETRDKACARSPSTVSKSNQSCHKEPKSQLSFLEQVGEPAAF